MVQIAKDFPEWRFWTYTKMYWIVNDYVRNNGNNRFVAIPANLSVMFSEWDGVPLDNPYSFPVFSCKLEAGNKNHPEEYFETLYECPGNCDICIKSGHGCVNGESGYVKEH